MPLGQLLTSLAAVQEAIGNPIRSSLSFPNTLYNGTSLLHFLTWALNSTVHHSVEEINTVASVNLTDADSTTNYYNNTTPKYPETHNVDSLSIMWYLASFGTLVLFFLLISFSEVCCKKSLTPQPDDEAGTSPPPYDLFAPPTYDSLFEGKKEKNNKRKKKRKCEVFVISVFGDKNKTRVPSTPTVQRNSTNTRP